MKTLLIVYHSRTGGTHQMVRAAAHGAEREAEVVTRVIEAGDAEGADMLTADAYVFATPENLAAIAGRMKDFFDRAYYEVLDQINGRPFAILVCAGSDGENAVRQIRRIATGWRLREVAEPIVVCTHAQTKEAIMAPKQIGCEDLSRCESLGEALAAGIASGIF